MDRKSCQFHWGEDKSKFKKNQKESGRKTRAKQDGVPDNMSGNKQTKTPIANIILNEDK